MVSLPASFEGFRELASLFEPTLAPTLVAWASRLLLAIGPMRAPRHLEQGEPDGTSGIGRRGPYERLLLTEWLLATEAPDEFTRRAASNEHAFTTVARKTPQGGRATVALFDVGHEQVGAPRVAHLPLLLALARRADAAGAKLRYGVLRAGLSPLLFDELNRASLSAWAAATSQRVIERHDVEAAARGLAPPRGAGELFVVGGPGLARAARGLPGAGCELSTVAIDDVAEPGARALSFEVSFGGGARQGARLSLELPPEDACLRLLQDPFAPEPKRKAKAPGAVPDAGVGLFFADSGRRLFVQTRAQGLAVHTVLTSPHAKPQPAPVFVRQAEPSIVAAAFTGSQLLVLRDDGERVYLEALGKRGGPAAQRVSLVRPQRPVGRIRSEIGLLARLAHASGSCVVHDRERRLVQLFADRPPEVLAEHVLSSRFAGQRLWALSAPKGPEGETLLLSWVRPGKPLSSVTLPSARRAVFGLGPSYRMHRDVGVSALELEPGRWLLLSDGDAEGPVRREVSVPEDVSVIGLWASGLTSEPPQLIAISADRLSICLHAERSSRSLCKQARPIASAVIAPHNTIAAMLLDDGELVVRSLFEYADMFRVPAERAP